MRTLARIAFALGASVFMAEQIARYKPGENLTAFAKKSVAAGRFVKIVGRTPQGAVEVEQAAAKAKSNSILGVTQRSADEASPATSVDRLVEVCRDGSVARVEAKEEIKVGEEVMVGPEGKAQKSTENPIGVALSTVTTEGQFVEVDLRF